MNYDDKHYQRRKSDLENRLNKVYDKIEEAENSLVEAKAKKRSVMVDKVCGDNIYNTLIYFDKMNAVMDEADRREFLSHIIEKVEIHEEEQHNGQWLKSITFKLPIIPHDMEISLDKGDHVETVVLLSQLRQKPDDYIDVDIDVAELEGTSAETKATYEKIKKYVAEHNDGMKVSNLYIAQVKRKCGLELAENFNLPKSDDARQPQCPKEKEEAIIEALKEFQMI